MIAVSGRGEHVDLSGADLSGADLSGVDLFGADLSGAELTGVQVAGQPVTPAELVARTGAVAPSLGSTSREREIAELVHAGLSNAEIAARLLVSVRTVEGDIYRIARKMM
ncbi:putative serine/threonine protein kinase [Gordonia rhizosphera NBRC 16068]|uniref:Putative serine/threonine protein kinase n=1 Tax=Gordonia rhizosphera NBRC 16068 TaxID=1108045 RepID=K6VV45_9ACTN|nr:putative serine/threonine protein kinase [Gordonia rhizosphera NBRC 16068]